MQNAQNGQTYFENLTVWIPQDFWSMFGHFTTWMKGLKLISLHFLCYYFLNFDSQLLKLQEVSKASDYAPSRTFYLFRVDMPQVARLLLNRCYQVISLGPVCFVISIWPALTFQHYLQFRKKWLEQSKEIKQNWTGRKNFDICFYVIFGCYDHQFISGRDSGH